MLSINFWHHKLLWLCTYRNCWIFWFSSSFAMYQYVNVVRTTNWFRNSRKAFGNTFGPPLRCTFYMIFQTWYEAVVQSFFSLSVGFGALITYSSYNQGIHYTGLPNLTIQQISIYIPWHRLLNCFGTCLDFKFMSNLLNPAAVLAQRLQGRTYHIRRRHLYLYARRTCHLFHPGWGRCDNGNTNLQI